MFASCQVSLEDARPDIVDGTTTTCRGNARNLSMEGVVEMETDLEPRWTVRGSVCLAQKVL